MTEQGDITPENLGIVFGEPPPPPRKNERDDDLWKGAKVLLLAQRGKWAKVKTWDRPDRAGAMASQINNGKNKTFPATDFEARYESERKQDGSGSSSLWLMAKQPAVAKPKKQL